jgi:hypothetical protein
VDYFGHVLDELTEIWEQIAASPHAAQADPVLKALERAMQAAAEVERSRTGRGLPAKAVPIRSPKAGSRRAA